MDCTYPVMICGQTAILTNGELDASLFQFRFDERTHPNPTFACGSHSSTVKSPPLANRADDICVFMLEQIQVYIVQS